MCETKSQLGSSEKRKEFHWNAHVSSMGTLDLALSFPNAETEEEKIGALSIGLVQSYKYMLDKGYLSFKNSFCNWPLPLVLLED